VETGHIADLISAYALAFPTLRFSLSSDDRLVFQSPGTGEMRDVLVKVFGVEIAQQLFEIGDGDTQSLVPNPQSPVSNVQVNGFISPPNVNRATRKHLLFFVNHRWIQDRTIAHAVIEAYHTALMVGRFRSSSSISLFRLMQWT
jgi:DNA mismatch repair protein MutL